jgi:uncharacterized membrane protein YgaE (UPF0421/DUF939 family)
VHELLARARAQAGRSVRDPIAWSSLIQLVKTVVASVVSWVLASEVFGLPQAFLAPWAALLVVHATVYRTFSRGVRQVTAAVLGVVLAWSVGNLLGLDAPSVAVLLFTGLVIGSAQWFAEESTTVAATGLIVLTTGFSTQGPVLVDRLFDTAIGVVVGLVVNLVVWPPLRDYTAAKAVDRIDDAVGALLRDMAEELAQPCTDEDVAGWVQRTRDIDEQIDEAWALIRLARESSRLNPRRAARSVRGAEFYEQVVRDNEQAVAECRSIARTLGHSIDSVHEWDPYFRKRWLGLLQEAGDAIGAPDAARVTQVRAELGRMAAEMSTRELPEKHWAEYGALLTNLRNVVTSMDRVAEANPVVLPRYAGRDRLLRG